jgi:hypothetical protein
MPDLIDGRAFRATRDYASAGQLEREKKESMNITNGGRSLGWRRLKVGRIALIGQAVLALSIAAGGTAFLQEREKSADVVAPLTATTLGATGDAVYNGQEVTAVPVPVSGQERDTQQQ